MLLYSEENIPDAKALELASINATRTSDTNADTLWRTNRCGCIVFVWRILTLCVSIENQKQCASRICPVVANADRQKAKSQTVRLQNEGILESEDLSVGRRAFIYGGSARGRGGFPLPSNLLERRGE